MLRQLKILSSFIFVGFFCLDANTAPFDEKHVTIKSNTSRDIKFYVIPSSNLSNVQTIMQEVKGDNVLYSKIDLQNFNTLSYSKVQKLSPNATKIVNIGRGIISNKTVYLLIARQGESLSGRNLSHKMKLCGPMHHGTKLIVSTKKTLGFDKGTICKVIKK